MYFIVVRLMTSRGMQSEPNLNKYTEMDDKSRSKINVNASLSDLSSKLAKNQDINNSDEDIELIDNYKRYFFYVFFISKLENID